jgi:hypothetical protein
VTTDSISCSPHAQHRLEYRFRAVMRNAQERLNNQVVPFNSPADPRNARNAAGIHSFCAAVPEVRIHLPPAQSLVRTRFPGSWWAPSAREIPCLALVGEARCAGSSPCAAFAFEQTSLQRHRHACVDGAGRVLRTGCGGPGRTRQEPTQSSQQCDDSSPSFTLASGHYFLNTRKLDGKLNPSKR